MSIIVSLNGSNISIDEGSLSIDDNINDRSTFSFSYTTTSTVSIGQEVIVYDGATKIFGGTIQDFSSSRLRGTSYRRININCIDYNQLADRRRIAKTYANKTVEYIVDDIISVYLGSEGITKGTVPADVPTIIQANFNYIQISQALQYIQDATGINWNIDYDKKLNLFYREDNFDSGYDSTINILDATVNRNTDQYRNIQYVKAGDSTTEVQSLEKPSPKPDGVARTFLTRFPLAKKPDIFINSVQVSGTDIGINGLDQGKKWYWNKEKKEISQDDAETVLSTTDSIEITYQGLIPILIIAEDIEEQDARKLVEGGTGKYEDFEQRRSMDDKLQALEYANGLLNKYGEIPETIDIRTRTFKVSGKIVPVTITSLGISDNYLIESVSISEEAGILFYDVKLLSGESYGSWVEFFRKMTQSADDFVIQENEVVLQAMRSKENRVRSGTYETDLFIALFPATDLYPEATLYPDIALVNEEDFND